MSEAEPDWYGAEPQTPPRTWDFVLTLALTVLMLVLGVVLFFATLSGGIFNAACSNPAAGCNTDLVGIGHQISLWAPGVVALVAVVWSVVRVLRRKIGFWVALIGVPLMFGAFLLGRFIIDLGIPDSVVQ